MQVIEYWWPCSSQSVYKMVEGGWRKLFVQQKESDMSEFKRYQILYYIQRPRGI